MKLPLFFSSKRKRYLFLFLLSCGKFSSYTQFEVNGNDFSIIYQKICIYISNYFVVILHAQSFDWLIFYFSPEEVYHVTVMPCYDKKLEAARDDFVFQVESEDGIHEKEDLRITEVDSVLTSGEVLDLIQVSFKAMTYISCNSALSYSCSTLLNIAMYNSLHY